MLLIVSVARLPRRDAATDPLTAFRRLAENLLIAFVATALTGRNRCVEALLPFVFISSTCKTTGASSA